MRCQIYGDERGDAAKFGFEVYLEDVLDYSNDDSSAETRYFVQLPHSCDAWTIAGEHYKGTATKEEAIADLEAFIAEATDALKTLKEYDGRIDSE